MAGIKQVLDMAEAAAKAGDVARAVSLYRQILTKVPRHSKAKKALARLEKKAGGAGQMTQADAQALLQILNTGNFAGARDAAKQLAARFPNEPFVFNILGYASGMVGDEKAALEAYRWAIKLNPNFVEALSNYGSYLVQIGRLNDAIATLTKAVTKKPDYAEAHHNLGIAYFSKDELDLAAKHYDRALAVMPNYANALNSRGTLREKMQDKVGAQEDFRAALKLSPKDASVMAKLGSLLEKNGESAEGFSLMKQAIALEPSVTDHHLRFAVATNETGDKEGALAAFNALLEVDPTFAEAYRLMADLLPKDGLPAFATRVETLFAAETSSPMDRVHFGFTLGFIFEKVGDADQSYRYLNAANTIYRGLMPQLPETDAAKFKRITKCFENGHFKALQGANATDIPIFIVGLMRSGTSLVEQIVATHSQVYGAGELTDITDLSEPIYKAGRKATLAAGQQMADTYIERMQKRSRGTAHSVDKMPGNFFQVGLIKTIFPNAKIINMVRDPRDTCFSIYKNFFDTYAHQYAYDQAELATFANSYKRMMNMWDELFPGAVYHAKYEDLVADQEAESRKLLDHLGLPWEAGVLDFHKTKRAVRTASVNQVRQKVYTSSVKSWEPYAEHLSVLLDGLDKDLWADAMVD